MRLQILFHVLHAFLIYVESSPYSASFYGDSFLFEKYSDFSTETNISLQFQTQSENGLLLIAAGQNDYLIISLKNGRIKIDIKTSSGKDSVHSPSHVTYNDLLWHDVKIARKENDIELYVNNNIVLSHSLLSIAGDPAINIDLGVFLGGYDRNVGAKYLSQPTPFFHGCILDAQVNGVDVLEPIYNVPGSKIVHNVDAGCSTIFRLRAHEAIQFLSTNAYLKYSRWPNKKQGVFECDIRTTRKNGIILFNTGWQKQEFIGLELFEGSIRASVNKGAGVMALQSTEVVNDNEWHTIRFSFTSSVLQIEVDHNRTEVFVKQSESERDLRLRGHLFIGGVDAKTKVKRSKHASGINFNSFPGCIRNIRINGRGKVSRDILSSHDLRVGCKKLEKFNAITKIPSLPTFYIVPEVTKRVNRTKNKFIDQVTKYVQRKLCYNLTYHSMTLHEGQSRNISTFNLQHTTHGNPVTNDNSASFFTINITRLPHHGTLTRGKNLLGHYDVITIDDVMKGRIFYTNDGSEEVMDSFEFEIGNEGISDELRSKDGKHYYLCHDNQTKINTSSLTFVYKLNIVPINDVPYINIPINYVFRPIKNARTQLPSDVLQSLDNDNDPPEIVYRLLSVGGRIYLDSNRNPGRPVVSFTQQQIDNGEIYFVDTGVVRNTRLLFQLFNIDSVSEPLVSETYVLRISTQSLSMKLTNHVGITLIEGETKLITNTNLLIDHNGIESKQSENSLKADIDVQYRIGDDPHLGQIQVLKGNGVNSVWSVATMFLQSQLSESRVRYLSLEAPQSNSNIAHDRFIFSVYAAGIESESYEFNITILKVRIQLSTIPIHLKDGLDSKTLSNQHIILSVNGLEHLRDNEIQFIIVEDFQQLDILNSNGSIKLSEGDSFTFNELKEQNIIVKVNHYKLSMKANIIHDQIRFYVLVRRKYRSTPIELLVTYIPDTKLIKIHSTPLLLDEGGQGMITSDSLSAQTLLHKKFLFKILEGPKHGRLNIRGVETLGNLSSFTSNHLADGNLYYKHDGSESISDEFKFVATPILLGETPETVSDLSNSSIVGVFDISIDLINDNPPKRVIDQPFNIAQNSARLLTPEDLWYHDPDIDQDDLDLKYVRRGISNGDVINATSKRQERLFEFTQRDIVNNRVLFKHKGRRFGRFVFWVRDGKNFATGLFIVNASSPYIKLTNFTALLVLKNDAKNLTKSNMLAVTNVKGLANDIIYKITEQPKHGDLMFIETNEKVAQFTQQDINENKVAYFHTDSQYFNDVFKYSVSAGNQVVFGSLSIRVYLASSQQPPVIKRNRLIIVNQGSSVMVSKSDLRATHVDIRPREIIYLVTTSPRFGHIMVNDSVVGGRVKVNASSFTQHDINHGSLWYLSFNESVFEDISPRDKIVCVVTNGLLAIKNVTITFEIIPNIIPLRVSNFTVGEGKSKVLIKDFLYLGSEHFNVQEIQVDIITQPEHGRLESSRNIRTKLENFSMRLAQAEFVYYIHDGSDTIEDSFQLQARLLDGSKVSVIKTTFINIEPDNDQTPSVVNNTGATVWVNSTTILTPSQLGSYDLDSYPQNIYYEVIPPRNGHLSYSSKSGTAITSFTQEDINKGNISFVHSGSYYGGFTFQVNDGSNYDVKRIFVIKARPLVITVLPTHSLQVFPNTTQQISITNLYAKTNDDDLTRRIIYQISKKPSYGKIVKHVLKGNLSSVEEVNNFTQSEVELGSIFYKQDVDIPLWQIEDKVQLKVTSSPAQDVNRVQLNITISYDEFHLVDGKTSSLQLNTGGKILEGGKLNITINEINAQNFLKKVEPNKRNNYAIVHQIVKLPAHGKLYLGKNKLKENEKFNMESNHLSYIHDDSENFNDSFNFKAQLISLKKRVSIYTIEDKFKIDVFPANDNPPTILTKSPFLQMVHGTIAVINQTILNSIDIDKYGKEILYKIIRPPSYGKIMINQEIVTAFTQHDVNQNLVHFQQNIEGNTGISEVVSQVIDDAFYFSLSDGKHKPSYSLFRIKILPVTINLYTSPLYIPQGSFSALLTTDILHPTTNANLEFLVFNVTTLPNAGSIVIDEKEKTTFSYHDLSANNITYMMNDVTRDEDHMVIMMKYNDSLLAQRLNTTAQLNIVVTPLVKTGNSVEVSSNQKNQLTLDDLDATQLAQQTNSIPVYHIIGPPTYADIVVYKDLNETLRKRRSVNDVISFTHYDIINGDVYLNVPDIDLENKTEINDQLIYKLQVLDGSVQPAVGNLEFKIVPKNTQVFETTAAVYNTSISATPELSTDYPTTELFSPTNQTTTYKSTPTIAVTQTTETPVDPGVIIREVSSVDSPITWIIPLLVGLSIILLVATGLFCFVRQQNKNRGPAYVRGHETTLIATSNRGVVESLMPQVTEYEPRAVECTPQITTIDSNTTVKVTSRPDVLETPEQCPTTSVTVTALSNYNDVIEDDDVDDYYDDGYLSNSVPLESILRGTTVQAVPIYEEYFNERSHSMNLVDDVMRSSSQESIDDVIHYNDTMLHTRNRGSLGSIPGARNLSAPPGKVNQYWV